MRCPACAADNADHRKFCDACGAALRAVCPQCGAAEAGSRFCGECGAPLTAATAPAVQTPAQPVAERRLVSLLFVDLVGFTTVSETRDAEAVRELLSRYFEVARTVVGRYGGVIEKFIGDAVMAVWGVPSAHGDDAERAVRAALDLVDSVAALGASAGAPGLSARAGVVTGEVAVTIGAVGEGMVAGDAVNTAARVQATAEPGAVYVDDTTRSITARAIAYADTGEHELKGKAETLRLWRVTRVVGAVGGAERVDGLEATFLGRDRELRAVKEAFHTAIDEGRARLVSVIGAAGVGKSRLRWEFFKYIDGLVDTVLWHSGRCLPYGEGVAYWALAEIVRARLDIAEEEPPDQVSAKLTAGLERWVTSDSDREFLLPRLGALIGATDAGLGREELFAGWRLWLERLAEHDPVVVVIEDLQWADAGLLDFVEHLLDWSADHPIFVLTFTRPELADRRPTWASGRRNATTLSLDPLPSPVMAQLLAELVPGLPGDAAERIVAQADGVPLYAVELVRSLIDRDLVQPVDGVYRLVGEITDLDVPASLSSLVAARIDALPADERTMVQALAVLGSTFPRNAVQAVTQLSPDEVDAMLATLVRKEILAVRTDRLSPDRGQYAFGQSLLRSVAYDTLSRRDRKARHLAVAAHLRATFADDGAEVAEVIAQHYADAYLALPDEPDAHEIKELAMQAFVRAGQRAANLGAPETAQRAYTTAAELTSDEAMQADLLAEAGKSATQASRFDEAVELLQRAVQMHRDAGRVDAADELLEEVAFAFAGRGQHEDAIPMLLDALAARTDGVDPIAARLAGRVGRLLVFAGHRDQAVPHLERALALAQALEMPDVLAGTAQAHALALAAVGRHQEALAITEWGARVAEQHGDIRDALTCHGNAADLAQTMDLPGVWQHLEAALAIARRRGNPDGEAFVVYNMAVYQLFTGHWDEAEALLGSLAQRFPNTLIVHLFAHTGLAQLYARRGQSELAQASLRVLEPMRDSGDVQDRAMYLNVAALVAATAGDLAEAQARATESVRLATEAFGSRCEMVRAAWPLLVDVLLARGLVQEAQAAVDALAAQPIGHIPPFLRAHIARFRGRFAADGGRHDDAAVHFTDAEQRFADLSYPYWLAGAQLDHGEWLVEHGRRLDAEQLLDEAGATFDRLGAAPELTRVRRLRPEVVSLGT